MSVVQFAPKEAPGPRPERERKEQGWILVLLVLICIAGELYGCYRAFS